MNFAEKILLESILNEGGYSRLMQQIYGLVPSVKMIAIITWENPQGENKTAQENNLLNQQLQKFLDSAGFGYRKIKGKYGNFEYPFFIYNIVKEDALSIGKTGSQESIVFGDVGNKEKLLFDLIECSTREVLGSRTICHTLSKTDEDSGKENFAYSEYKGRKFIIPFFDEAGEKINESRIYLATNFNVAEVAEIENIAMKSNYLNEAKNKKSRWLSRLKIYNKINTK